MTNKAKNTEVFTAKHENGKEWTLSVNNAKGAEFADAQAKNFARNYCRKHRVPGTVTLTSNLDGRVVVATVTALYTV